MRDVPRSHPQAEGAVLTTLRAACLFLMHCKAEYKTHVRLESGDESPHSKDASRRGNKRKHLQVNMLPAMDLKTTDLRWREKCVTR